MTEQFIVLEGALEVFNGAEWKTLQAGDSEVARPTVVYGFRNSSDQSTSLHKPQGEDSEGSSYLLHSEIEPPSQKKPQRSTVHVPDLCGNLFDTCLAGLQEMHRAFNAQTLEIRHRRFPQDAM